MLKVVITGAECSGKTTLANDLCNHYGIFSIPEYSRTYLNDLDRPYLREDLLAMARWQVKAESDSPTKDLVICDTSLLVLKIWSMIKYDIVHPTISTLLKDNLPDLYILPDYNIPYEEDPLREHPTGRVDLYKIYIKELESLGVPWLKVTGTKKDRRYQAVKRIDTLIETNS